MPMRDALGTVTHFMAIEVDIDARKQAEAAQRAAHGELEKTVSLLDAVLNNIEHGHR